jgi:thiol:disulfide interchange protein DsbD
MQKAATASGKGGYAGSFVTGIFAVLLSTPCSAPLLGSAIGFAFTQPSLVIILLFLIVGLGLAIPFILLGFWPKVIQKLPKPGNWMVTFEQLMGFLLLAAAIWLLDVLHYQIGGSNLIKVLIFLALLGFAAWIYGRFARPQYSKIKQWIASIIAIIIIIISGMINLKFNDATIAQEGNNSEIDNSNPSMLPDEIGETDWKVFSPQKVESLIKENKPVFIDFTAKWCMTCKVNESAVLNSKTIQDAFKKYNVSLFRGDYTNKDEVIGQWMKKLGKGGVPVYVLYVPGKAEPILLPEILTKEIVLNALENISK